MFNRIFSLIWRDAETNPPRNARRAITRRSNRNAKRNSKQRVGAAAVEFAVVAPVMIALTFGLIEMGRMMMVKNAATQACREGARLAVTPTANSESVEDVVRQELELYDISASNVIITPSVLGSAQPGDTVSVKVQINVDANSWIPGFISLAIDSIESETQMRREST